MSDSNDIDNSVYINKDYISNPLKNKFDGEYILDENDEYFDLLKFENNLKIKILKREEYSLTLEIDKISVSIANALRRIMISEVPTVAIETVKIYQNTGIIADEILCHRLGLIPFKFDPDLIKYREVSESHNFMNSFCFKLCVDGKDLTNNCKNVYSKDLKWIPLNEKQHEIFKHNYPRVVDGNILITKLIKNQEIDLVCFLEKGIGKTHAKWSPVSTVVYRMYPSFTFNYPENLTDEEKIDLINICPKKVFDIEDANQIIAKNPLDCSSCRACIEKYPRKILFRKIKDRFIFTIESTGCYTAEEIFRKGIKILKQKCLIIKERLIDYSYH